ncbi:alpha/beta hydrolase [Streptomyces formicae]|uniref:Putative exported protease n=1 Tax=Streptomyces formicae TaxID=1616117 RepID=A0A291QGF9_9ACTN|nr:alpha/beta hydrolase [Streptomyces formicae]ATL30638.1 putative exported protease [Streptomyces formicae]
MNRAARHVRPLLALSLAALAATSLVGCSAADGSGAEERAALKPFYAQRLKWTACGDGLRCARLTVPRDYAHPENGKTFVLPVAKAVTADPGERVGSLVYNPGGPGASGVSDLKSDGGEAFSESVRARFDIVSFDPRGVGGSEPAVRCDEDTGEESEPEPITPATTKDRARAFATARAEAAGCVRASGDVLRQVGTVDAARDLDVLRAALGESKLTYLGWSYGTSLGTSYAEQFPHRVRALVLDGAIDPSLDWRERALSQGTGFRRAVDDYAEQCADIAGDSCPGATPAEISELIEDLYEEAAREPLPVDDEDLYDVDARTLLDVVTAAMYTPEDEWEGLSDALTEAADGDGTKLAALAEDEEPSTDSHRKARGTAPENDDAAIIAVSCLDTPHPRTPGPYWDALTAAEKSAGVYGTSSVVDELTCANWPTGTQRPHRVSAKGVPPVLVVGTTGDPATPYEEAESLADQFPGGMLLTYEGVGHTAYGRAGSCVTEAVDAYLIDRKPVRPGATC